jgi:protein-tyrosine phosphatase
MPEDLRVDFLGPELTGLPGRLGLTRAPGLRWPGRAGPAARADPLGEDLGQLAGEHGATLLVTLLTRRELDALGGLRRSARALGMAWIHHPIPDMEPPASPAAAAGLVALLADHLSTGRTAVVHCLAGLGRTGTVAACLLVAQGRAAGEAIAAVRSVRPGSVQSVAQASFVEAYAVFHQGGGRRRRWPFFG